ncbi:trehalose-phosphatase [Methylocystis sp. JAN1]|uniref:trehalose-phosphatase n=1 Tax=Methylocystis sp. JAN1 TaxID=3397211 RepID=UPI003FA1EC56
MLPASTLAGDGAFLRARRLGGASISKQVEAGLIDGKERKKADWALFLDFDGTLVDVAPTPETIRIPLDLCSLLGRLMRALDGALAVVTGRSVTDVERYLASSRLVIAGEHGAELRIARDRFVSTVAAMSPAAAAAVSSISERFDGAEVEVKRSSIAVHYRANPEAGPGIERELRRLLSENFREFVLCRGRKVYELVPAHVSKGAAIDSLMRFPPFLGRRPIMIGDDFTDEAAFQSAELHGGMGLKVAGEHFSKDVADFNEPAEVRAWLAAFAAGLGA